MDRKNSMKYQASVTETCNIDLSTLVPIICNQTCNPLGASTMPLPYHCTYKQRTCKFH